MSHHKFAALAFSAVMLGSVAFVSVAYADGIDKKPETPATPLDKAIDQIENKEPPVAVAPPAPEPVIEQTPPPPAPEARIVEVQENTSFFGLSIGAYDVSHDKLAASFNLEWQPGTRIIGVLQPLFGAFVTTRGSVMGYGGIGAPFHIGKRVFVMPSFAVGAYGKGGGYDLGRTLAFRAGTELAYEFDDKSRIGLNIHAISNGESLRRKDRTEIISLVYTVPFNLLSGKPKPQAMPVAAPAPAVAPPPPEVAPAPAPVADQPAENIQ
ncbi:MAG: acyloxyacyl hydrolase [Alphaproteobacteria bacterium]